MSKVKKGADFLSFIKKLTEEAKSIKPIVKEASQTGGSLLKEGQLAKGQKIVQKLPTSEEYIQKMNSLKRAAGITGTIGASSLISQEEANAAGITTLMKKLGVTKEVAQEIKTIAKNVPPDVFEQNIKAIQDVSQFKKDPKSMQELGRGIDAIAYDAGDNVVKSPRLGKAGVAWNSDKMSAIPSVVENTGLGAKTKTIKTSKNKYQVQEKLSRLGDIGSTSPKFSDDPILNKLKDKELELMFSDKGKRRQLSDSESSELFNIRKQYANREAAIFKELNIPEEVLDTRMDSNLVDSDKLEEYLKHNLNQRAGSVVEPRDLHSDNVGLDKNNQMKILDTGNFMSLDTQKMTPAMKKKAIQNYIALPPEKARFEKYLDTPSIKNQPLDIKKAAAVAGTVGASSLIDTNEAEAGMGTKLISRKETIKLLLNSIEDNGLNVNKLLNNMGVTDKNIFLPETQDKMMDVLGHLSLEKTGRTEDEVVNAIKQGYPEIDKINPEMINPSANLPDSVKGAITTETYGNRFKKYADPVNAKMRLSNTLDPYPVAKTGVGFHEGEHVRQQTLGNIFNQLDYPSFVQNPDGIIVPQSGSVGNFSGNVRDNNILKNELIANYEKVTGKKITDPSKLTDQDLAVLVLKVDGGNKIYMGHGNTKVDLHDLSTRITREHHGPNIKNYELEKIKELNDNGLIVPTTAEIDQRIATNIIPESANFNQAKNASLKKAAAGAPIAIGGELGQEETSPVPEKSILDRAKELGIGVLSKGIGAYENLSPDTRNNISAGLNVLSQPGAALRGATYAAQTGQPIIEGTQKAWNDPETAPTGEQIAEATGLDDSSILGKTAIATAAEFADPIDWTGLGLANKATKLKVLGKLK